MAAKDLTWRLWHEVVRPVTRPNTLPLPRCLLLRGFRVAADRVDIHCDAVRHTGVAAAHSHFLADCAGRMARNA